jgi:hypothetical protein
VDGKAGLSIGKQAYGGEEPQKQVLHVTEELSLMDLHHVPHVASPRRRFASSPDEALACVLDF